MTESNDYYIGGVHILWVLFWVAALVWFVALRIRPYRQRLKKNSALNSLNKRFASGEIDTLEYITYKNPNKMKNLNECIEISLECALTCEKCITTCINDGNKNCALICRDCADICALTAQFLARGSEFTEEMLILCSKVCKACSEECAKHADHHEGCKECAEVCRKCADLCARVSES